jgi:hypothetical protein
LVFTVCERLSGCTLRPADALADILCHPTISSATQRGKIDAAPHHDPRSSPNQSVCPGKLARGQQRKYLIMLRGMFEWQSFPAVWFCSAKNTADEPFTGLFCIRRL